MGQSPVDAIFSLWESFDTRPLPDGFEVSLAGEGEWQIAVDVFRDPGRAFAAALAGIVVRNSIILIDSIEQGRTRGLTAAEAGIEAGSAVMGAWVIVFEPIYSGLAWSFVFGIPSSTVIALLVIPVAYALTRRG